MRFVLVIGIMLLFLGCPGSTGNPEEEFPLRDFQFEFLQGAEKLYFAAHFEPEYLGKNLDSSKVIWYGVQSASSGDTIRLNDSGTDGDIIANDDKYSRKITNTDSSLKNTIPDSAKGNVFLEFQAYYSQEIITVPDSFQLSNIRPTILQVDFPDTMVRPDNAQLFSVDTILVEIFDANGLSDIQSCYLMFQKPDSTYANSGKPILLYDDGEIDQSMFLWDEYANDGIYSRLITIGYSNPLGVYKAYFYVQDYSGDYAETVVKTMVVVE